MQASEFIKTDAKMQEYAEEIDNEEDDRLNEDSDILYELLREY